MSPQISRQSVFDIWVVQSKPLKINAVLAYILQELGDPALPDDTILNSIKVTVRSLTSFVEINNDLIAGNPQFSERSVRLIESFLDHLEKPLCFFAHNGDDFHYPILKKELLGITNQINDVFVLDTLAAFRELHPNLVKHNLEFLYKSLCENPSEDYPSSEKRLIMLIECVASCGSRFYDWAFRKCNRKLSNIRPLQE